MINDSVKKKCEISIGRLSKVAGVNVETIRYYQRIGLIDKPMAPSTGGRKYPCKTAKYIKYINCAKKFGFSMEEIRKLLRYWN